MAAMLASGSLLGGFGGRMSSLLPMACAGPLGPLYRGGSAGAPGAAPLPWHSQGCGGTEPLCAAPSVYLGLGTALAGFGCAGWGRGCPGPTNSRVIISAVCWGLACFPAVSGTGKGRQYRDVIREGGGVPVEIPSPGRKTMCVVLPNWERVVLGEGGASPKGSALG